MDQDWAANVKKYVPDADDGVISAIVKYCGIALRKRDSSLVSMSDPVETGRVRENFLKKKLGLTHSDAELDAAIAKVGERMKGENFKNRVTVYYLLLDHFDLFTKFGGAAKAAAGAAGAAAAGAAALGIASLGDGKDAKKATAASDDEKSGAGAKLAAGAAAVGGAAAATASTAAHAVSDAGAAIKDTASAAVSGAADLAHDAGAAIKDTAGAAATGAANLAHDAGAAVAGAAGAAAAGVGALASGIGSSAAKAGSTLTGDYGSDDDKGGGLGWLLWLLLGLLALFLLWWLFLRQPVDTTPADAGATAAATTTADTAASDVAAASTAPADLAAAPAEGSVTIPTGAGVTVEMRDGKPVAKVYFDTGKTEVVSAFSGTAAGFKEYLAAHPGSSLEVSGYNDPTGNAARNAELSKNRAKAVGDALVAGGIAETSVALVKPANATDTQVDKAAARRVEVVVK